MKTATFIALMLFQGVQQVFPQDETVNAVLLAANSGYTAFLERITPGEEPFFGFTNRSEFSKVSVGKPYQIFALQQDVPENPQTAENYLTPTGEWWVTLTVDDEARALVAVVNIDGTWRTACLGFSLYARKINDLEKQLTGAHEENGVILRVYELDTDFILTSATCPVDTLALFSLAPQENWLEGIGGASQAMTFRQLITVINNYDETY